MPGRWRLFALILCATLAATEIALRFVSVRVLLPPRSHFYDPGIARRLDALEMVLAENSRVDVMFIGSSIVLTNVDPVLFDWHAGAPGGRLISFNAGLAGLWPGGVDLYARHVWLPMGRPRIVVQGIRYPELAATTDAKNDTQIWTGKVESAWRESDLWTRVHATAVSRVHLLQYHGVLTYVLQQFRSGWTNPIDTGETLFAYAGRGYRPRGEPEAPLEDWAFDLPNEGTCGPDRCQAGFDALRRTIGAARNAGSTYVLVNVPEHASRWQAADGARRYRDYVDSLRVFAAEQRVRFIDPTDGDPLRFGHARYSDLSHFTVSGARVFTRTLAEKLLPVISATAIEEGPSPGAVASTQVGRGQGR